MDKLETITNTKKGVDDEDESEKTPVGEGARTENADDKKIVRRLDHISVVLDEIRRRSYDPVQRECPTCHAKTKANSSDKHRSEKRRRSHGRDGGWCLGCISGCCKTTIVTAAIVFLAMMLFAYLYRNSRGIEIEDVRRRVQH